MWREFRDKAPLSIGYRYIRFIIHFNVNFGFFFFLRFEPIEWMLLNKRTAQSLVWFRWVWVIRNREKFEFQISFITKTTTPTARTTKNIDCRRLCLRQTSNKHDIFEFNRNEFEHMHKKRNTEYGRNTRENRKQSNIMHHLIRDLNFFFLVIFHIFFVEWCVLFPLDVSRSTVYPFLLIRLAPFSHLLCGMFSSASDFGLNTTIAP